MQWVFARMSSERIKAGITAGLILLGSAAALFLLWKIRAAVLAAFAAVLLALVLDLTANGISRVLHSRHQWSLLFATLLIAGLAGLCLWLFAARLSGQFTQLLQRVQQGAQAFGNLFPGEGGGKLVENGVSVISRAAPGLLSSGLDLVEYVIVTVIAGLYLAVQPRVYVDGFAELFPDGSAGRARNALGRVGASLRLWALGQFILMLVVGVLAFIVARSIGLPNPVVLGFISGLSEIVPYLGPFIGAAPAVLAALAQSVATALWTIGAYLAIHTLEGYVLAPYLHRRFISIPPALVLVAILVSQTIFGFAGVVFAAPLAVAIYAAVKVLYIGGTLHEPINLPTKIR